MFPVLSLPNGSFPLAKAYPSPFNIKVKGRKHYPLAPSEYQLLFSQLDPSDEFRWLSTDSSRHRIQASAHRALDLCQQRSQQPPVATYQRLLSPPQTRSRQHLTRRPPPPRNPSCGSVPALCKGEDPGRTQTARNRETGDSLMKEPFGKA